MSFPRISSKVTLTSLPKQELINNKHEAQEHKHSLFDAQQNQADQGAEKPGSKASLLNTIALFGIDPKTLSKGVIKALKPEVNQVNKGPDNVHPFKEFTPLPVIMSLLGLGLSGLIFKVTEKPNKIELKVLVPKLKDAEGANDTEVFAFDLTSRAFNVLKMFNAVKKARRWLI